MNILKIAKSRYSCRKFTHKQIDKDILLQIIEAARIAPSAANVQPWHFIVVQSPENLKKIYESYERDWIKNAPCIIVACGDTTKSWKRADGKDHVDIDIAIALDHLILAATELGLGTCWVCNFKIEILKRNLELPEHIEPIAFIPIGYSADKTFRNRHDTKRKPINDILHWEEFRV